jgi:hypothetical protein
VVRETEYKFTFSCHSNKSQNNMIIYIMTTLSKHSELISINSQNDRPRCHNSFKFIQRHWWIKLKMQFPHNKLLELQYFFSVDCSINKIPHWSFE